MTRPIFDDAVEDCLRRSRRFTREAYYFVRDSLDHSQRHLRQKPVRPEVSHVTGAQLCEGLRQHAIDQFGPLSRLVLESWGVRSTSDVGSIVYLLIETGAFFRSETDSRSDFNDVFDFADAFDRPFLPTTRTRTPTAG
jgi:uncharacterized repeat protein (TIGR04138 family)